LASRLRIPPPIRRPSLGPRGESLLSSSRVNGRPQAGRRPCASKGVSNELSRQGPGQVPTPQGGHGSAPGARVDGCSSSCSSGIRSGGSTRRRR
jgi:hypothetical protein